MTNSAVVFRIVSAVASTQLGVPVASLSVTGGVVSSLGKGIKDNAGYNWKHLLIGSEGSLGIVTRAVLRLRPLPRSTQTALVAFPDSVVNNCRPIADAAGTRIQQAFIGAGWFIRLMNIYYGTLHFVITVGVLAWLYVRHADVYRRMRNLLGLTTALALIGYWAFPLAPPRLYKCNDNIPVPGPDGYSIGKCF